jgi:hypothetical protein
VTFEKEDSVETVMKLDHEIMGKYVETKRAEPRDSRCVLVLLLPPHPFLRCAYLGVACLRRFVHCVVD